MSAEGPLRDGETAGFELIETLRWEPGGGFLRLPFHLARLENSARELGFAHDPAAVDAALKNATDGTSPLRVRLMLARDGTCTATVQPFVPFGPGTVWKLAIAETRIDAGDPLVRHKTTRRAIYEAARAEFPSTAADEVLLFNSHGFLCEGTITNVFLKKERRGPLLTPALACGLLPGVLRAEMLASGKVREAMIGPADLATAFEIHVGNSLRGLIPARLGAT